MENWRRINIFVSSTFKDMDAERDILKFDTQRRLNEYFRKHCLEIKFIDLRLGVNTEDYSEQEAENKVLKICFEHIDNSRPYFLSLLGERYGWIPDYDRLQFLIKNLDENHRRLVIDGKGKSVTELEILYGAIGGGGEHLDKSFFFMRSPDSYAGIPDDILPQYADAGDSEPAAKQSALKSRIMDLLERRKFNDRLIEYSLRWDWQKGTFTGLDSFADLAFETLKTAIEKDLPALKPLEWWEEEMRHTDYLTNIFTVNTIESSNDLTGTNDIAESVGMNSHTLLVGPYGSGKTTTLARKYAQDVLDCNKEISKEKGSGFSAHSSKEETAHLIGYLGTSAYSWTMAGVLAVWNCYLEKHYGLPAEERDTDALVYDREAKKFLANVLALTKKKIRVKVYLDNLDHLLIYANNQLCLAWVVGELTFYGTATESVAEIVKKHVDLSIIRMGLLNNQKIHHKPSSGWMTSLLFGFGNHSFDDILKKHMDEEERPTLLPSVIDRMIKSSENYNLFDFPRRVEELLSGNPDMPIKIFLKLRLILNFSGRDIHEIRSISDHSDSNEIKNINAYLTRLVEQAPDDTDRFLLYTLQHICRQIGNGDAGMEVLGLIAASVCGLNEDQLAYILGDRYVAVDVRNLMRVLEGYVVENPVDNRWIIPDMAIRQVLNDIDSHATERRRTELINMTADNPGIAGKQLRMLLPYLSILVKDTNPRNPVLMEHDDRSYRLIFSDSMALVMSIENLDMHLGDYLGKLAPNAKVHLMYGLMRSDDNNLNAKCKDLFHTVADAIEEYEDLDAGALYELSYILHDYLCSNPGLKVRLTEKMLVLLNKCVALNDKNTQLYLNIINSLSDWDDTKDSPLCDEPMRLLAAVDRFLDLTVGEQHSDSDAMEEMLSLRRQALAFSDKLSGDINSIPIYNHAYTVMIDYVAPSSPEFAAKLSMELLLAVARIIDVDQEQSGSFLRNGCEISINTMKASMRLFRKWHNHDKARFERLSDEIDSVLEALARICRHFITLVKFRYLALEDYQEMIDYIDEITDSNSPILSQNSFYFYQKSNDLQKDIKIINSFIKRLDER